MELGSPTTNTLLDALLRDVENLLGDASWFPASDVGTDEMLVSAFAVRELQGSYDRLIVALVHDQKRREQAPSQPESA